MPSNATAKTKSALKALPFWVAILLFLASVIYLVWLTATIQGRPTARTKLVVPGTTYDLETTDGEYAQGDDRHPSSLYYLERAAGVPELKRGLSGRRSLPSDQGMLFTFDKEEKQCLWMKDMYFALDIVWVDAQKKVVGVEHDISPETYPEIFCHEPAKYVIELSAGEAKRAGIQRGQTLTF
jgi:uncharacterized protein